MDFHILEGTITRQTQLRQNQDELHAGMLLLGYEVFDSKEDFKKWLMTPVRTLGNKIPFELLDSSFGFEMVENEIIRIQYNIYS